MKSRSANVARCRHHLGARTLVRFTARFHCYRDDHVPSTLNERGVRRLGNLRYSRLGSLRYVAECAIAALALFVLVGLCIAAQAADSAATNSFRSIHLPTSPAISEVFARQFSGVPGGLQTFHRIPFQIDSPIAVTGIESARNGAFFPTETTVQLGASARRIHLLHGTLFADKDGVPVAKLVFHYAGGRTEAIRLGYGVHTRDWVTPRLEKHSGLLDPNTQLAWSEADDQRGIASRLFQTAIENPQPSQPIESLSLISLFSHAAPFILALTVEGFDSALPPNRPSPARKPVRELRDLPDSAYRGEITVRITDSVTGAPPKDCVVSLGITDDKESYFFGEAKPDAQGVCRTPYPRQHAVGLSVWTHAPDRLPVIIAESRTNLAKFTETYSVTLKPGIAVGGLVKDEAGKEVVGAQVIIHRITRISPHHYGRVDYDAVLTGNDGTWLSRSLPEDLSGFSFQVLHPDYRPALFATLGYAPSPTNSSPTTIRTSVVTYRTLPNGSRVPTTRGPARSSAPGVSLLDTNALLAQKVEMTLRPALLLQGRLVDTEGKPIPSAEMIVQRDNGDRKYLRTDAQGHFVSRAGEGGLAAIIVVRSGFAPLFRNVNIAQDASPLEIRLSPPRTLHGRVVDRKQQPVSGARVRVNQWNGTTDLLRFQTVTDEQGNFVWTGAPADQATFLVSKTNFNSTSHSFSGLMDNITIPISGAPGVYGKVYDAETKKPIESFVVIPGRKYSSDEDYVRWDRSDSGRGAGGEYSLRISSYYFQPEARVLVEAPGYEPQSSRPLNGMDSYACDFALKKGKGISGLVLLPDGSPAVGAGVLLVEHGENGSLTLAGQLRGSGGDVVRTDMRGHFEFSPKLRPEKIFASHDQGFAEVPLADVVKTGKITLQKWGRVKGRMLVGEKGETDAGVQLQGNSEQTGGGTDGRFTGLAFVFRIDPEGDGTFDFDRVPPGEHRLAVEYRFKDDRDGNPPLSHGFPVTIKPGETTEATLGGTGRRVAGRVQIVGGDQSDVDWKRDVHRMMLVLPPELAPPPASGFVQGLFTLFGGPSASQPMTAEAMRARQRAERTYVLLFDTNGIFHVDNVPPGKYMLSLNFTDPEDEYYNRRSIGSLNQETVVPDERNAKINAPLEIGELKVTIHPRVKVGEVVPAFEAKTSDGKMIKLSDFRGKPVLLHLWGMSLGWSSYDIQVLKEFQSSYAASGKLAIIGCNLDADARNAEQYAKSQGFTWPQTYLGDWSQAPVAGMFGVNGSSICVLVDAEGRLASSQLRGTSIRTAVSSAISAE